jgi:hypothetical protein
VNGDGVIVGVDTGFHETPFCGGRSAPQPAMGRWYSGVARSQATSDYNVKSDFCKIFTNEGSAAAF